MTLVFRPVVFGFCFAPSQQLHLLCGGDADRFLKLVACSMTSKPWKRVPSLVAGGVEMWETFFVFAEIILSFVRKEGFRSTGYRWSAGTKPPYSGERRA